jgi:hypothetical protein
MSLDGFQRALGALLMTPGLRAELARLPPPGLPEALAHYELTERERQRLHAVARQPGMRVTTVLHRAARLSMLSNTLPRTCVALGGQGLQEVTHRYWKEHPPTSVQYVREALRFAGYLHEHLRAGTWVNPLLPEVLEAEVAMLELSRAQARAPAPAEPPLEGDAWYEAHPRLTPWCRVIPFRREPLGVLRELSAGRLPPEAPEGEYTLVLESVAPGRVAQHSMDAARGRLLRASTGERSVSHLCAEQDCLPALVRELTGRGFLQVTPGG